ncbi:hypothetical protein EXN66_Car006007 [Channa argus]|uniref:Uncharacterized protein n=1 Tax=Channa argus TaxID=215402 RepID=A0A6G1PJ79_CHAAH|nr:hypothetical protein EXN66_Car006007 [Channa argus]
MYVIGIEQTSKKQKPKNLLLVMSSRGVFSHRVALTMKVVISVNLLIQNYSRRHHLNKKLLQMMSFGGVFCLKIL